VWYVLAVLLFISVVTGSHILGGLTGLLLAVIGSIVVFNLGGVADRQADVPVGIGPFWQKTSPALVRLTFAVFAVVGLVWLVAAISGSLAY